MKPLSLVPTEADRAAADRAIRLAHEHGHLEVMTFYAEIPEAHRPIVFALMARHGIKGGVHRPTPADTPSPWWTAAELREAHRLFGIGYRAPWIVAGHRAYQTQNARARRAVETPEQTRKRRATAATANRKRRAREAVS